MIATLSSWGAMPSLASLFSSRKLQDAQPNWSLWTCGRNTYCRFLSLNTAEATQTLAHMNFFCASTFCASGTQWALEYTPMIRSTFSWLSRRSASAIATSALDWASATTGVIL